MSFMKHFVWIGILPPCGTCCHRGTGRCWWVWMAQSRCSLSSLCLRLSLWCRSKPPDHYEALQETRDGKRVCHVITCLRKSHIGWIMWTNIQYLSKNDKKWRSQPFLLLYRDISGWNRIFNEIKGHELIVFFSNLSLLDNNVIDFNYWK